MTAHVTPPSEPTTTWERSPVKLTLEDGTRLFTVYSTTRLSKPMRVPVVIDGALSSMTFDAGYVRHGPTEEWVQKPDGTMYRGSHYIEAMGREQPKRSGVRMTPEGLAVLGWFLGVGGIALALFAVFTS